MDPDRQLPPSQEVHGDAGTVADQIWQLEEFNRQCYNTEEQGVFPKLSIKEMAEYTSPLNYITMVEALKNGSHTMTLQRICKNSIL
jgi:hypothetical protein